MRKRKELGEEEGNKERKRISRGRRIKIMTEEGDER
jgi:hypothetical protein